VLARLASKSQLVTAGAERAGQGAR
jgi:hypothetical protein